jgi:hypothetical protein
MVMLRNKALHSKTTKQKMQTVAQQRHRHMKL